MIMICKVKDCNRDTEFDIDFICNYHWKMREKEATIAALVHDHKEGNL